MAQYDAKKDIEFLKSRGVTSERDQISWLRDNRGVKLNSRSLSELASGAKTYDNVAKTSGTSNQQSGGSGGNKNDVNYVTGNLSSDVDESGALKVSKTMEKVGNVGAGKSRVNVRQFLGNVDGRAILYDEKTGDVYLTNNWKDVDRNEKAWVDNSGRRFSGWVHPEEKGGTSGWSVKANREISHKAESGGYGMYAAFGGQGLEAGTKEYEDWALGEYRRAIQQEKQNHTYNASTGKLSNGSKFGQYGQVSLYDWVKMGRPGSVGGMTVLNRDELNKQIGNRSDSELLSEQSKSVMLTLQDQKIRHHGLAKLVVDTFGESGLKTAQIASSVLRPLSPVFLATGAALSYDNGKWKGVVKFAESEATKAVVNAAITLATMGVGSAIAGAASAGASAGTSTAVAATTADIAVNAVGAGLAGAITGWADSVIYNTDYSWSKAGKNFVISAASSAVNRAGSQFSEGLFKAGTNIGDVGWYADLVTQAGVRTLADRYIGDKSWEEAFLGGALVGVQSVHSDFVEREQISKVTGIPVSDFSFTPGSPYMSTLAARLSAQDDSSANWFEDAMGKTPGYTPKDMSSAYAKVRDNKLAGLFGPGNEKTLGNFMSARWQTLRDKVASFYGTSYNTLDKATLGALPGKVSWFSPRAGDQTPGYSFISGRSFGPAVPVAQKGEAPTPDDVVANMDVEAARAVAPSTPKNKLQEQVVW